MVWCFSLILVVATVYSSSPSTAAYECGFPGRPSHGHVNVTINQDTRISFPIGTIVLYKCPKPYHELQGLKQRICLENGKWSGTRPWCECGSPGLPLHGLVDGRSDVPEDRTYPAGAKVKYSCPERGMKLFGNEIRECVDGRWLGSLPWCGSNIIVKKPVITEIDSPHSNRPMVYHIPEIADGVVNERAESHCLLISSEEKHVFKFVDLGKQSVHQMLIYTKKPFPLLNNDWEIDIPTEWSYHVTTKSSSPAIVIENDRSIQVNELAIGIVSQVPLEICEIELYAQTDSFTCGKPEVPAHGRLSFVKIQDVVLQVVHYSCDAGYQIDGPARRTCNGTQWAGSQPICVISEPNTSSESTVNVMKPSKSVLGSTTVQEKVKVTDRPIHPKFTQYVDTVPNKDGLNYMPSEMILIVLLCILLGLLMVGLCLCSCALYQITRGKGDHIYERLSFLVM